MPRILSKQRALASDQRHDYSALVTGERALLR